MESRASHPGGSFPSTPPRVLVGVCGGIAAYKVATVVRLLRKAGVDVRIVPTPASLDFVGITTWKALSGQPVYVHTPEGAENVVHVNTGQRADLVLIAPATANTMAKVAAGIADNLLTASVLVATCPVMMAPAMHTEMWNNAATQANAATLRSRGVEFIGPESGHLTGSDSGIGRMSEPETIAQVVLDRLGVRGQEAETTLGHEAGERAGDLAGLSIAISAGGTREPIDPVRFIANHSTGRMGVELANEALARGATVSLVSANIDASVAGLASPGVQVSKVSTACELQAAMEKLAATHDVIVMSAAVSDFRVDNSADVKIKRGAPLELSLVENPDILADLARHKREGQIVVGFAAETGDEHVDYLEYGRQKARRKGADLLVINRVGAQAGFGDVDTTVTIVDSQGRTLSDATGSKRDAAAAIMTAIARKKSD
ncbi:bifunctional phosphopantothenoylcysteine decarboxylase/phosphopantothenate--cysteine ligase CoaBC [Trueperella pecoris]|uniref:Coenzyme A biosynthesis bifunctional protein CoaBC n=1 Tax=Trueperella pecoris TaxID=2733571 RepID=A0A7M1R508_9ACTO|nr:bifunctional phosphopantothenoylcysteine decarboxylase/phosphopantothenate--cysteine ligase CoaBC [Trueperella pecoris]